MTEYKQIGLQLRNINNMIKRAVCNNQSAKMLNNMTGTNAWLIVYIGEHSAKGEDVFQKDIEEHFGVTRSSVSKVIKLMEQKGMVAHETVDHDARLKKLVLTDEALCLSKQLESDVERLESSLCRGFTEKEINMMSDYLERIRLNVSHEYSAENTERD